MADERLVGWRANSRTSCCVLCENRNINIQTTKCQGSPKRHRDGQGQKSWTRACTSFAVLSRKCWWRYRCDSSPSVTIQYNGMNRLCNSIRTLFIDWLSHTLEFVLKLLKMYHLCNLNYIASMPLQTSSFSNGMSLHISKIPKRDKKAQDNQAKHRTCSDRPHYLNMKVALRMKHPKFQMEVWSDTSGLLTRHDQVTWHQFPWVELLISDHLTEKPHVINDTWFCLCIAASSHLIPAPCVQDIPGMAKVAIWCARMFQLLASGAVHESWWFWATQGRMATSICKCHVNLLFVWNFILLLSDSMNLTSSSS